jgi:SAM-dependent methyltransferase
MCGSGRFLVPFASRGADIDGVDASADMLASCRRKLAALALLPRLYLQFLQDLDLPRQYRFAFIPAGSFVLVPLKEQEAALNRIARHLLPRGELIVEILTSPDFESPVSPSTERRVTRPDGSEIALTCLVDGSFRYDLIRNGDVVESEFERHTFGPRGRPEFVAMLEEAGFTAIRSVRPHTEIPASDADREIVYICRKAEAR